MDISDTDIPLKLIKIEGTGRNNLDFHLIYHLGKCQVTAGELVEFVIFSKDAGWDHLIKFIQKEGRVCRRIAEVKTVPKRTVPKRVPNTNSLPAEVQPVISKLLKIHPDKRPKRLDKLTNHLISVTNSVEIPMTVPQLLVLLKQQGFITVGKNNRIEYHF